MPLVLKASAARPRRFHLLRERDVNGISGTGRVATGVVWPNGWVSLAWGTETPSLGFYESIEIALAIHGHDGATEIIFDDPAESDATVNKGAMRGRKKVLSWRFSSRQRAFADWASVTFAKVDAEKRVVYGVVLDPYIIDAHDDWIPPNEVEETAWGWLEKSRRMCVEHQTDLEAVPVESYVMPYPTPEDYARAVACEPHRIYKLKLGTEWVHSGSWVLATRILDEAVWRDVASGDLGAYSIGGFGMRREVGKVPMPDVEILTIENTTNEK